MRRSTRQLHAAIRAAAGNTPRLSDDLAQSLRFIELAERPDGPTEARRRRWLHDMGRTERFAHSRRRLPTHHGSSGPSAAEEAQLADWLTYQRRRHERNELCLYERKRLEALPGFTWTPHLDHWERRLEEYEHFLRAQRRPPRLRSTDPNERSLADWITRQRTRRRSGRLTDSQRHALDYVETRSRMGLPEHRRALPP